MENQIWLAFGDIHSNFENFEKILKIENTTGFIISGDITNIGGIKEAQTCLDILRATGKPVLAQIGNMDKMEIDSWLDSQNMNIHAFYKQLTSGVGILGLGYSNETPFNTPSEATEEMLSAWLVWAYGDRMKDEPWIFVSHTPPFGTAVDKIGTGTSVGSKVVRDFIEEKQPNICITGHIHEAKGECYIGKTHILNPGEFRCGGFVRIIIKDGVPSASLEQLI